MASKFKNHFPLKLQQNLMDAMGMGPGPRNQFFCSDPLTFYLFYNVYTTTTLPLPLPLPAHFFKFRPTNLFVEMITISTHFNFSC